MDPKVLDERVPVLVVGDAPTQPTGLARIARDVTELLRRDAASEVLPIRVAQLGLYYTGERCNWHVYRVQDEESWGQNDIGKVWEDWRGSDYKGPGVIFSVWDPGRCAGLTGGLGQFPIGQPELSFLGSWGASGYKWPELWGYFAIDAENPKGAMGGPVPEVLQQYQRLLAYGLFGVDVLKRTTGREADWLPHGIDLDTFKPQDFPPDTLPDAWTLDRNAPKPPVTIGVIATNTPRKDLGLVFAALDGVDCRLWLHTNKATTAAWSVAELAQIFGRNNDRLIVTAGGGMGDLEIARWLSLCDATIAPGLGEGFGYPIVESLACGTPVVHLNYAGGSQWIPDANWRFSAEAVRLEGPYALVRPVPNPKDLRVALQEAVRFKRKDPQVCKAFCHGSVLHLDWRNLWPWWRAWWLEGLKRLEVAR